VVCEETPTRAAIVLLITRILLIEPVIWLDRDEFSPALTIIVPLLLLWWFHCNFSGQQVN
jgi:hypothetical protein